MPARQDPMEGVLYLGVFSSRGSTMFHTQTHHKRYLYFSQIGDFGMARDLDVDNIYQSQGGKIPLKWTAPEVNKYE